jgi:hypothetical protein
MPDPKHPIHDLFSPQPGDPTKGVANSVDQRPRDGRTQGIDQDVGESVGTPRVTESGIETAPLEGEQI